jgi:hypothetical protein
MSVLEQNLAIARSFEPLSQDERNAVDAQTVRLAGDGRYELFKSAKTYDGVFHRKQHGFALG